MVSTNLKKIYSFIYLFNHKKDLLYIWYIQQCAK